MFQCVLVFLTVYAVASASFDVMDSALNLLVDVMDGGPTPPVLTDGVVDFIDDAMFLEPGWLTPEQKIDLGELSRNMSAVQQIWVVRKLTVAPNSTFYFTCKARVLEDPEDAMWVTFNTHVMLKLQSGSQRMLQFGRMNHVRKEDDWVEIGGDFATPPDIKTVEFLVSIHNRNLPLEVSPTSLLLTQLLPNPKWREEANKRIEALRKGKMTIKLTNTKKYPTQDLKFELEQTKSSFPVGSAISGGSLGGTSPSAKKYQNFFYENFNWGTPENDLKWRIMERKKGHPNFRKGDKGLGALEKVNYGSRGHCLLWSRSARIPAWLNNKTPDEIKEDIIRRFSYIAEHYGSRFTHWDVNNEQLHEAWYAEKLNEPRILSWMFKEFHSMAPSTKLFTNDFQVLTHGILTQSYKQQVKKLLEDDAPVHGIGMQTHFARTSSVEVLTKRLAVLSELGLPLWMTEFDLMLEDEDELLLQMEDLLRLGFSHPNVGGIIFWGFWEQAMWRKQSALAKGPDYELTAAGHLYRRLFFDEWRTNKIFSMPGDEQETFVWKTDAFFGTYKLTAFLNNETLWSKDFELAPKQSATLIVDI